MKRTILKSFLLVLLFFSASINLKAQVPNAAKVTGMAVYNARPQTNANKPDNTVNYNIVGGNISTILGGIDADVVRDCSGMEAKNMAYLYVKYMDGSRDVYEIYNNWSHLSYDSRKVCYFINTSSQTLLKAAMQP